MHKILKQRFAKVYFSRRKVNVFVSACVSLYGLHAKHMHAMSCKGIGPRQTHITTTTTKNHASHYNLILY